MAGNPRKRQAIRRGSSSTQSQQPSYNPDLFRSLGCEQFYQQIEANSKFVKEKAIILAPGDFEDIRQNIHNRGWDHFVTYPKKASKALVYEFFSNIFSKKAVDGNLTFPKATSYVRGHIVPFDKKAINGLFGIRSVDVVDSRLRIKGNRQEIKNNPERAAEISSALCKPGMDWVRNVSGDPWKIMTNSLTPAARGWASFVLSTLCPSACQSELNIERAALTACIIRGEPINIGFELEEEISSFAKFKDGKQPSYWRHASLISLLCEKAGVVADPDEETIEPAGAITGSWIRSVAGGGYFEQPVHNEEPYPEQPVEEEPTFTMGNFPAEPHVEDFQHLQARMDLLALNQQRMEANQQRMEVGMRNMYRAMCMMHSGAQMDPDADIFQAPPPDSGRG